MKSFYRCNVCKGEDLIFDALTVWDRDAQKFEVLELADPVAYCNTCDTDTEDWGEYTMEEA